MTNQQKLKAIHDLTGKQLFNAILQAVGPGSVYFTKDGQSARRKTRNMAIRADYYSAPEYMTDKDIYRDLAERYGLRPDTIRKIVKNASASR